MRWSSSSSAPMLTFLINRFNSWQSIRASRLVDDLSSSPSYQQYFNISSIHVPLSMREGQVGSYTSMAGRCENLDLESHTSDTSPLLMDQQPSVQQEHVVTIRPDTDSSLSSSTVESGVLFRSLISPSVPQEGVPRDASSAREQYPLPQASYYSATPSAGSVTTSYSSRSPLAAQGEVSQTVRHQGLDGQDSIDLDRFGVIVQRFKMMLNCYLIIWFLVGNLWIFGRYSSASEAPNLFRLCVFVLTVNCIKYAVPFILCATICCCLPCIIAQLAFREYSNRPRGASADVISALLTYKFEAKLSKNTKANKDVSSESDSEGGGDGGIVALGTEKERQVSAEDAVCCICLGKYGDGVELRELPCTHHFHVECVDKWLKINASCPLCKNKVW